MDSEVPRPCRHFLGREEELDELHTMLEENSKVFLYGIAGIGKSELAKAYAKQYKKYYTNILYVEYAGDLHQAVTDMDFTDDLPEDGEEERFRKHNRFLRSLKDDTLLIIDNFNVTATQDSFLPVVLKYRCRILFTTRSISPFISSVLIFSFSNTIAIFRSRSMRTYLIISCVFLENREIDFVRIISISPF